ncbi:MAG: hypothetical protein J2P21_02950 [Chloracidobacterium sp.]|nr:hypothetical protein [Chloracidobacterium sp.]
MIPFIDVRLQRDRRYTEALAWLMWRDVNLSKPPGLGSQSRGAELIFDIVQTIDARNLDELCGGGSRIIHRGQFHQRGLTPEFFQSLLRYRK